MELRKGDEIEVIGNSIFKKMGFNKVLGKVFLIYPGGNRIALQCYDTEAMELVHLEDGEIKLLG